MKAIFATLLILCSCASTQKHEDTPLVATARDYAPLAIGKSWTYQAWWTGQKGEMTINVVKEEDGYLIDDKGGEFRFTQDGLRDKKRYLIRHPLTAGASWQTVVSASAVEHNKIVSVGERCECAAGSFPDCLVVESTIRQNAKVSIVITWTWARGVGLVKFETEAEIAGQGRVPQVKNSLIRYGSASDKAPEKPKDGEGAPDSWTR